MTYFFMLQGDNFDLMLLILQGDYQSAMDILENQVRNHYSYN